MTPDWIAVHVREALDPFIELIADEGIQVTLNTFDSYGRLEHVTHDLIGETDQVIWLGLSDSIAKELAEQFSFRHFNYNDSQGYYSVDGWAKLGAGDWIKNSQSSRTVISVPKGRATSLPIISALQVSGDFGSGVSEYVLRSLVSTDEGKKLINSITIIPVVRMPDSFGTSHNIKVRIRPEYDDDGDECGCDNDNNCDPEGYVINDLSDLSEKSGRVLVPGFFPMSAEEDGGDGCDPCEENSAWDLAQYQSSQQMEQAMEHMVWDSINRGALQNHFYSMSDRMNSGDIAVVLTCDPE